MSKTKGETYAVVVDADGNRTVVKEKALQKLQEEATKAGEPPPEAACAQTFSVVEAENVSDFVTMVPDEAERVNLFNRGVVLKQQAGIRQLLLDANFSPVEGAYDLSEMVAEKRERRAATPEEKALKALAALPPEVQAAILAKFQAV